MWNFLGLMSKKLLELKEAGVAANKLYIADFMKNYHNEIANLLENGLEVNFTGSS